MMLRKWMIFQVLLLLMVYIRKSYAHSIRNFSTISEDKIWTKNNFISPMKNRSLDSSKDCYSDSTMNSDILKKNRTNLYPFRYKFTNITTKYLNLYVRVFNNQDIFVSGQMTASEFGVPLKISSNQSKIPTFMRINGYNGIVKWSTVVCIKDNINEMIVDLKEVNTEDIAFIQITQLNNIFFIRIDGDGNAFQMIGFQNKNLNSLFQYAEVKPVSLTSFMLVYNTDQQQYGFSVSNTSGIDLAYLIGNFDLTVNYTLMIDYYNDYPYFKYQVFGEEYLYLFYISSNNYPQVMIKTKIDFFNGINYNETSSESCCYLGLICIPLCNASYSDRFMPIIKPLMLIPNLMTDVYFNKNTFILLYELLDGYLIIIYTIGNNMYNVILFNPDTLIYSQSFTVTFPYQILEIITKTLTNWMCLSSGVNEGFYFLMVDIQKETVVSFLVKEHQFSFYNNIEYDSDFKLLNNCSLSLDLIDQKEIVFINTTQTLQINYNYTSDGISIKVVQDGISFFNTNYSPFPRVNLTFNETPNLLFWPETIIDSNGSICQSSPPKIISSLYAFYIGNNAINSSYTEEIKLKPYYNCQDIPMNISITGSNLDENFISHYVSIQGEEIIINVQDFQISDSGINLDIQASTFITSPIERTDSLNILLINKSPVIQYSGNTTILLTDSNIEQNNILEVNFTVADEEQDELLYSAQLSSNLNVTLPTVEISQNGNQFLTSLNLNSFSTGLISVGAITLEFKTWDKYHLNSPSFVDIEINFIINESSRIHFKDELPLEIIFIECEQTSFELPLIVNPNNSTFTVEILKNEYNFLQINLSALSVISFNGNYGKYSLIIKLSETNGNSNYYSTTVTLESSKFASFGELAILNAKYMIENKTLIDVPDYSVCGRKILNSLKISDYISRSILSNFIINIRNNTFSWLCVDQISKRIDIHYFNRSDIGNYTLSVNFINICSNQLFSKQLRINLLDKKPPSVVGKLQNITAFKGQDPINIMIPSDLFYDPDSEVAISFLPCTSNTSDVTEYHSYLSNQRIEALALKPYFVGECENTVVGTDSIFQSVKTSCSINVIECKQNNCELCNDSSKTGCIKCKKGYTLELSSKYCSKNDTNFEVYLLFWFIILCIPIMIFTDYCSDTVIIFFESMQILYALFSFLPSIGQDFKIYLESFQYLSFGCRDVVYTLNRLMLDKYTDLNKEDYSTFLYAFPETILFLLVLVVMFMLQSKCKLCSNLCYKICSFILQWIRLSFLFLGLSILSNLFLFYKINSIYESISIALCIILLTSIMLYMHCCIITFNKKCCLCSKFMFYEYLKRFTVFNDLNEESLLTFFYTRKLRKIIILAFILIVIKGYLLFVYIACILIIQVFYQMITFSKEFFKNTKDRICLNIIEIFLFSIILSCFSMLNIHDNMTQVLKFIIKIYITIMISFEVISICIYFTSILISKFQKCRKRKLLDIQSNQYIIHTRTPPPPNLVRSFGEVVSDKPNVWKTKTKK